jgi:hypothetical protein
MTAQTLKQEVLEQIITSLHTVAWIASQILLFSSTNFLACVSSAFEK